jgi:hypothetical protein
MFRIKNVNLLSKIEMKQFYDLLTNSNMNKEIDNSIIWELLYLRKIISKKSMKSTIHSNTHKRYDYLVFEDGEAIGYFCIRKPTFRFTSKKNNEYEIILYILETHMNENVIQYLGNELKEFKEEHFDADDILKLSVLSDKTQLISLLNKNSVFKLVKIDKQTFNIPLNIYQV